jgi:hypothetical protein
MSAKKSVISGQSGPSTLPVAVFCTIPTQYAMKYPQRKIRERNPRTGTSDANYNTTAMIVPITM